ncbi:unnamed protein product, partial [Rhizoctonia solani]
MVSYHRLASLESYDKYTLQMKQTPNGCVVTADPNPALKYYFADPEDSKFNLSSNVGYNQAEDKLVWRGAGFDTDPALMGHITKIEIWEIGRERFLRVARGNSLKALSLSLDRGLDILEHYDPLWREFRLRLGMKPDMSQPQVLAPRSIVLCFDGTSNHFSSRNTNVVKLVELLKKDNPLQQMVYYQAGVGTYLAPGFLTNIGLKIAARLDEAIAWCLYQHVMPL